MVYSLLCVMNAGFKSPTALLLLLLLPLLLVLLLLLPVLPLLPQRPLPRPGPRPLLGLLLLQLLLPLFLLLPLPRLLPPLLLAYLWFLLLCGSILPKQRPELSVRMHILMVGWGFFHRPATNLGSINWLMISRLTDECGALMSERRLFSQPGFVSIIEVSRREYL